MLVVPGSSAMGSCVGASALRLGSSWWSSRRVPPQSQVTRAIDDCSHFAFVQSVDARMDAPIGSGPGPRIWTYSKDAGQVAQLRHCVLAGGAQWIAMPA